MKINLAKSSGFCFGVKRAINIAFEAAKKASKIEMLGDIVHNEKVVKEIQKCGIKKIQQLSKGKNKTLLIRAHGAPLKTFKKAQKLGYKVIDATCPMVCHIHKIAQEKEKKGCKIIIIGDKKHDEVRGIAGQLKGKALVIDNNSTIPKGIQRLQKSVVVVQSTQNFEKTLQAVKKLRKYIKNLEFFNTICKPTRTKQDEIKKMPLNNDLILIVGSKTSANTKRLYQISKNLNKHSFWIQSKKDLKASWFKGIKTAGIMAGASTPESTTKAIIEGIKKSPPDRLIQPRSGIF